MTLVSESYYLMLQRSAQYERLLYQAYTILGNEQKANHVYKKILRRETALSLIRTKRLSESVNEWP